MLRRILLLLWVLLIPMTMAKAVSAAEVEFYNDGPLKELGLPFSESVRAGDLLFLSGQIGGGADDKLVSGGIKSEANQVTASHQFCFTGATRDGHLSWRPDDSARGQARVGVKFVQ